jgi:UrcA family protein
MKMSSIIAVAAACAALASAAQAEDRVAISTQGFDLSTPAGAKAFYNRLSQAVITACGGAPTNYLSSEEQPFEACYKSAMDKAVIDAQAPLVTALYTAKTDRTTELASR